MSLTCESNYTECRTLAYTHMPQSPEIHADVGRSHRGRHRAACMHNKKSVIDVLYAVASRGIHMQMTDDVWSRCAIHLGDCM